MLFGSYIEFLYVLIFVVVYNTLRFTLPAFRRYQSFLLLLGNLLIISLVINFNTLFVLLILMLGSAVLGRILLIRQIDEHTRIWILAASLTFLTMLFVIRNYPLAGSFMRYFGLAEIYESVGIVGRIGLSYILFRLLHFLVDCHRGKIKGFKVDVFLNYIFFFPTFLSGPIDRYNNFRYWLNSHRSVISRDMLLQGSGKIIVGLVKTRLIVPFILPYVNDITSWEYLEVSWISQLLMTVLAYTFYIYFDFSGYSDIAIGTAYLIGIKTPENFRNPYFSLDIRDFWQRWHMTFSSILGEYIFRPIVKGLSQRFPETPRLSISILGYMATFIICGLWHGSTMNFVYWGIWHGIGLSIYKAWSLNVPTTTGLVYKGLRNVFAVLITFSFVAFGWYFFMSSTTSIHNLGDIYIGKLTGKYSDADEIKYTSKEMSISGYGKSLRQEFLIPDGIQEFEIQGKRLEDKKWKSLLIRTGDINYFNFVGSTIQEEGGELRPGVYIIRLREVDSENWWITTCYKMSNEG